MPPASYRLYRFLADDTGEEFMVISCKPFRLVVATFAPYELADVIPVADGVYRYPRDVPLAEVGLPVVVGIRGGDDSAAR